MTARPGARRFLSSLQSQALALAAVIVASAIAAAAGVVYLDYRSSSYYLVADGARGRQLDLTTLYWNMNNAQTGVNAYIASADVSFLNTNPDVIVRPLEARILAEAQPDEVPAAGALTRSVDAYLAWLDKIRADARSGILDWQPANSITTENLFRAFLNDYKPLVAEAADDAGKALAGAQAVSRQQAQGTLLAALVLVALLLVLVSVFLHSTLRPLRNLVLTASDLAAGRQVSFPELARQDEVGDLARALGRWQAGEANRLLLSSTMSEVAGQSDLDRVVEAAVPGFLAMFGASEVIVSIVDPDGSSRVSVSEPNHYVEVGSPQPPGSPGGIALARNEILTGDLTEPGWETTLRRHRVGPVLSTPLVAGGRTLGVATMVRPAGAPAFTELDVHQAEVAGPFVAAAIQSGRLLRTLEAANRSLARADRQKSEFMNTVTHELRTPLNSILGFSELMLKDPARAQLNEKAERFIRNIHASGRRLLDVVNKIIDLGQLETGGIELDRSFVRLIEPVAGALESLEADAEAGGVEVRSKVPGDLVLPADPIRLQQVIQHLVSNGIRFTPPGGSVEVTAETTEKWVLIDVRDTGVGIAPADQRRIFEKFERVEVAVAGRPADGTGLGLALTKVLVELHGGTIEVVSAPGAGSDFRVRLPRQRALTADDAAA